MSKKRDLRGLTFGRLTVIELSHICKNKNAYWLCECECGNPKTVIGFNLKNGRSKSCGCLHKETVTKHGMEGSATYSSWSGMVSRCTNKTNKDYKKYGALGVCDRWLDFQNFINDMGAKPEGTSIDRVDNTKGYEPSNCRWANSKTQLQNRVDSMYWNVGGIVYNSLTDAARKTGIPRGTILYRCKTSTKGCSRSLKYKSNEQPAGQEVEE